MSQPLVTSPTPSRDVNGRFPDGFYLAGRWPAAACSGRPRCGLVRGIFPYFRPPHPAPAAHWAASAEGRRHRGAGGVLGGRHDGGGRFSSSSGGGERLGFGRGLFWAAAPSAPGGGMGGNADASRPAAAAAALAGRLGGVLPVASVSALRLVASVVGGGVAAAARARGEGGDGALPAPLTPPPLRSDGAMPPQIALCNAHNIHCSPHPVPSPSAPSLSLRASKARHSSLPTPFRLSPTFFLCVSLSSQESGLGDKPSSPLTRPPPVPALPPQTTVGRGTRQSRDACWRMQWRTKASIRPHHRWLFRKKYKNHCVGSLAQRQLVN